ncbi:MAG TPA: nucleotidyltransferase family protein [Vicinamibacterales bacterium]|jgi:hypothetical protein
MRGAWHPLLVRCARLRPRAEDAEETDRLAKACDDWDDLIRQAELHGLTPLVRRHLDAADAHLPKRVARALGACTARHRLTNEVRFRVLGQILRILESARIPVVVLKGPSLAALVYGDVGLRPMRDLDLLVPRRDADRAQSVLQQHDFAIVEECRGAVPLDHHLTPLSTESEGVHVVVEIHRQVFGDINRATLELEETAHEEWLTFDAHGMRARALGPAQMLWHLCHHLVDLYQPIRLISVVDVVASAERFAEVLDWRRIANDYPVVAGTLALLDELVPLPPSVAPHARARRPGRSRDVGVDYTGWPRRIARAGCAGRLTDRVRDTLRPPEWWLRLYYDADVAASRWRLMLRHARAICGAAARRVKARASTSL